MTMRFNVRLVRNLAAMWLGALCLTSATPAAADESLGLRVPEGFEVTLYADDALATDIYSMTVDAAGRVVVSGPGYVKKLLDDNGDGRADRAAVFSNLPKSGAHSMCFDGPDLILTGDDTVRRLRDANGDDVADDNGEIWTHLHNPEHGANGIVQGPDGWFYIICGNNAGVSAEHAKLESSAVLDPRCGAVARFSRDGKSWEVLAHGFRNPYDMDFNSLGDMFTVDSDNEREHQLPWYAPTRLFHIAIGWEHGWLLEGWQRSWNRPQSYFDGMERLVEFGRGSPTGLKVYRHRQFPERYRDGVFSCCWTFGRVYFAPLERSQAGYTSESEVFLQTTGDVGFAPVDLAVGPEGDLFVAVGGRGTRGSVFRVRYPSGVAAASRSVAAEPLDQVLLADEPLASWSRARWIPTAKQLGREAFVAVVRDRTADPRRQTRAVEVLTELFGGLSTELAEAAIEQDKPELTARVAWSVSRAGEESDAARLLAKLTRDADPFVRRVAWESLIRVAAAASVLPPEEAPAWDAAAGEPLRRVRAAMLVTARRVGHEGFGDLDDSPAGLRRRLARCWLSVDGTGASQSEAFFRDALDVLRTSRDPAIELEAVRLLQIGLGDLRVQPGQLELYSGYSGNRVEAVDAAIRRQIADLTAAHFPTADAELNRELARLLGMLSTQRDGLIESVAAQWTDASTPQDDLHYLIVMARLPGARSSDVTRRTAHTIAMLHHKMQAQNMYPDRNWPLRVEEAFEELCARDTALAAAVADDAAFGLADHSLFAAAMQGDVALRAARRLVVAAEADPDGLGWTPALVSAVAVLPDEEILPYLRKQWSDYGLRDAIVSVLVRAGDPADRGRLIEALDSPQADVVRQAADALIEFPSPGLPEEIAAALRVLRQYCTAPQERAVRAKLVELLTHWSGKRFAADERGSANLLSTYQPWFDWFKQAHPTESAALAALAGADAAGWKSRLAEVEWTSGNAERGRVVFERRSCHRCHLGGGKLGPALDGAAARFARDDLFAAIIDPSKDVSPLYQTTLIVTHSGKSYHGIEVYASAEGTLLQTGPDTTVRITGDDVLARRASRQSLMPGGLLDTATGPELADLYAFLQTLTAKGK